jgi:type IV secretion system protein VirB6
MACQTPTPEGAFIAGTMDFVDCQAQSIGEAGYRALATSASTFSPLLTLALTIFIAIIGYRLILGDGLKGREIILSAVKIGMVLVLATSWPTFQILAYDLVLKSPANLAQVIAEPAGIPGANGGLAARLQNLDNAMAELNARGAGAVDTRLPKTPQTQWLSSDPIRSSETLEKSRTYYSVSTIAAYASVRLVAGILLALGPLFILFLLFDATRGLFEGWIKILVGTILASTFSAVIMGVELAFLEPYVSQILTYRRAGIGTPMAALYMLVASVAFSLILLAAILISFRIGHGFRFPVAFLQSQTARIEKYWSAADWNAGSGKADERQTRLINEPLMIDEQLQTKTLSGAGSRARSIANAVTYSQSRESYDSDNSSSSNPNRALILSAALQDTQQDIKPAAITINRRRTVGRASAKIGTRDLMSMKIDA